MISSDKIDKDGKETFFLLLGFFFLREIYKYQIKLFRHIVDYIDD